LEALVVVVALPFIDLLELEAEEVAVLEPVAAVQKNPQMVILAS